MVILESMMFDCHQLRGIAKIGYCYWRCEMSKRRESRLLQSDPEDFKDRIEDAFETAPE